MLKEIEAVRAKLQKKIAAREEKLANLMKWCKDKYDVNWYGHNRYMVEYDRRALKIRKELKQLEWWHKQLYELHLAAVEADIEEGTHAEMVYLGKIAENENA